LQASLYIPQIKCLLLQFFKLKSRGSFHLRSAPHEQERHRHDHQLPEEREVQVPRQLRFAPAYAIKQPEMKFSYSFQLHF
jgi:hypothetical protein